MSSTAIKVERLSKRYRIGLKDKLSDTFFGAMNDWVKSPFINLRNLRKLTNFKETGKREPITDKPSTADNLSPITGNSSSRDADDVIWALKDVSFEVQHGEVLGIIGRNGAGKSTLLKILSRITEPTEGFADICGRVSSLLEVGTGFHPELTGRENVFLNGAILGMKKHEIRTRFDEIVDFSGIEKFLDTPVKRYSSGMYVRLAFAVASHLEPEVLLVDEVLAVGDAEFQKKCINKMHTVSSEGRTVLFVSHNMYAVRSLCNRCVLLEGGRLVQDGSPHEVVNKYLNSGFISEAERVWGDEKKAPKNAVVRWKSARIRNEKGDVSADIASDDSFSIELDYENLAEGSRLGTTAALFNEDGVEVLTSLSNHCHEWHNRPREKGSYRSTCEFPGKLLSEGKYKATLFTWSDNYSSIHREDNVLGFQIYDSGHVRGDYYDRISSIIKPLLKWRTERL